MYLAIFTASPGLRAFGFFGQFARDRVATRVVLQTVVEPAAIALLVLVHDIVAAFLLRIRHLQTTSRRGERTRQYGRAAVTVN